MIHADGTFNTGSGEAPMGGVGRITGEAAGGIVKRRVEHCAIWLAFRGGKYYRWGDTSIPMTPAIVEESKQQGFIYDAILSSVPDFAYTFDLEGRFTYTNRALLELWGLPIVDVLGKTFFELGLCPGTGRKAAATDPRGREDAPQPDRRELRIRARRGFKGITNTSSRLFLGRPEMSSSLLGRRAT